MLFLFELVLALALVAAVAVPLAQHEQRRYEAAADALVASVAQSLHEGVGAYLDRHGEALAQCLDVDRVRERWEEGTPAALASRNEPGGVQSVPLWPARHLRARDLRALGLFDWDAPSGARRSRASCAAGPWRGEPPLSLAEAGFLPGALQGLAYDDGGVPAPAPRWGVEGLELRVLVRLVDGSFSTAAQVAPRPALQALTVVSAPERALAHARALRVARALARVEAGVVESRDGGTSVEGLGGAWDLRLCTSSLALARRVAALEACPASGPDPTVHYGARWLDLGSRRSAGWRAFSPDGAVRGPVGEPDPADPFPRHGAVALLTQTPLDAYRTHLLHRVDTGDPWLSRMETDLDLGGFGGYNAAFVSGRDDDADGTPDHPVYLVGPDTTTGLPATVVVGDLLVTGAVQVGAEGDAAAPTGFDFEGSLPRGALYAQGQARVGDGLVVRGGRARASVAGAYGWGALAAVSLPDGAAAVPDQGPYLYVASGVEDPANPGQVPAAPGYAGTALAGLGEEGIVVSAPTGLLAHAGEGLSLQSGGPPGEAAGRWLLGDFAFPAGAGYDEALDPYGATPVHPANVPYDAAYVPPARTGHAHGEEVVFHARRPITVRTTTDDAFVSVRTFGEAAPVHLSTYGERSPLSLRTVRDRSALVLATHGFPSQVSIELQGRARPPGVSDSNWIRLVAVEDESSIRLTTRGSRSQIRLLNTVPVGAAFGTETQSSILLASQTRGSAPLFWRTVPGLRGGRAHLVHGAIGVVTMRDGAGVQMATIGARSPLSLQTVGADRSNIQLVAYGDDGELDLQTWGERSNIDMYTSGTHSPISIRSRGPHSSPLRLFTMGDRSNLQLRTQGGHSSLSAVTSGLDSGLDLQTRGEFSRIDMRTRGVHAPLYLGTYGSRASDLYLSTMGDRSNLSAVTSGDDSRLDLQTRGERSDIDLHTRGLHAPLYLDTYGRGSPVNVQTHDARSGGVRLLNSRDEEILSRLLSVDTARSPVPGARGLSLPLAQACPDGSRPEAVAFIPHWWKRSRGPFFEYVLSFRVPGESTQRVAIPVPVDTSGWATSPDGRGLGGAVADVAGVSPDRYRGDARAYWLYRCAR